MFKSSKTIKKQNSKVTYTNRISFTDADKQEIKVEVKTFGESNNMLYVSDVDGKTIFAFNTETAIFLGSILSDYIENGNLNKIEQILKLALNEENTESEE